MRLLSAVDEPTSKERELKKSHPLVESSPGLARRFRLLFRPLHSSERYYRNYANVIGLDLSRLAVYAALKRQIGRCEDALDLGCGTGYVTAFLGARGVDADAKAVAAAKRNFPTTRFEHKSLSALLAGRKRFGAVVCVNVLEHLPEAALLEFLQRVPSLLKPGGRLHVVYDDMYHPLQLLSGLIHPGMLLTDPTHVHCWTQAQFHDLLSDFFVIEKFEKANILSRGLPWTNRFGTAGLYCLKPKDSAKAFSGR